ncbi:MAG TPA: transglycosylase domain-containing protein [Actinomycetes bacterium]|nr:transglycosylase domain-containing protein [Actinomycetes bacterium]
MVGVVLAVSGFAALYVAVDVPAPNELSTAQTSVVYYAGGKQELGRFAEVDRTLVPLSDVPESVRYAVLAAEDRGFYENSGISPTGILRAAWNNISGGDTQGASTITQQYARNAYLTQDRTWKRKIKETILAIKLNRELSKDQILEDYLNTIYFGRGAYGIQAASQAYFRKDVDQLSVAEGAVLAAVIRSPSAYDPAEGKDAKQALENRFNYVIDGMVEQGWLDASEAADMKVPHVPKPQQGNQYAGQNGYLLYYVRDELKSLGFSGQEIDGGGLRITTTFDPKAQKAAEEAVKANFPTEPNDGVQAGLASVEPGTGRIVAMYGGKNFLKHPFNNATAAFPVGSSFKAFTLAGAIDDGYSLTDTFAGNSPFLIPGTTHEVNNQGYASYGDQISLLTATEDSVNTAFVDLCVQMGPEKALAAAKAAGVDTSGIEPTANVTLGFGDISPLDMAGAYSTFAAEGKQVDPFSVLEVRSASGELLYQADPSVRDAFTPDVANEVTYALSQVVAAGTGVAAQGLGRPAAGKTGNNEGTTAWFVGYTPQLSTAVGFYRDLPDDPQAPLNGVAGMPVFTGAGYPTQIWTAYMRLALEGEPIEPFPPAPAPVVTYSPTPTPTPTTKSPSPTPTTSSPKPTKTPSPTESPSPTETSSSPTPEPPGGGGGGGARAFRR